MARISEYKVYDDSDYIVSDNKDINMRENYRLEIELVSLTCKKVVEILEIIQKELESKQ